MQASGLACAPYTQVRCSIIWRKVEAVARLLPQCPLLLLLDLDVVMVNASMPLDVLLQRWGFGGEVGAEQGGTDGGECQHPCLGWAGRPGELARPRSSCALPSSSRPAPPRPAPSPLLPPPPERNLVLQPEDPGFPRDWVEWPDGSRHISGNTGLLLFRRQLVDTCLSVVLWPYGATASCKLRRGLGRAVVPPPEAFHAKHRWPLASHPPPPACSPRTAEIVEQWGACPREVPGCREVLRGFPCEQARPRGAAGWLAGWLAGGQCWHGRHGSAVG